MNRQDIFTFIYILANSLAYRLGEFAGGNTNLTWDIALDEYQAQRQGSITNDEFEDFKKGFIAGREAKKELSNPINTIPA